MDKFKNKYRIPSARATFWNYGWEAAYFVTICTKNMERFFGKITNGKMQLSEIGQIAASEWLKTFEMRPDMNLTMGEYIIMPDHFHAIIIIGKNKYNSKHENGRAAMPCGSSAAANHMTPGNQYGPQSKNLASIIRGFKIGVTRNARLIHADFAWQPRFHDKIIRDEKALNQISNYIKNNPKNWKK